MKNMKNIERLKSELKAMCDYFDNISYYEDDCQTAANEEACEFEKMRVKVQSLKNYIGYIIQDKEDENFKNIAEELHQWLKNSDEAISMRSDYYDPAGDITYIELIDNLEGIIQKIKI